MSQLGVLPEQELFATDITMSRVLAARAAQEPDSVFAWVDNETVSVADLEARVNGLSAALAERGLRPGDQVATVLGNHLDHIALFYAISRIGCVWVPINVKLQGQSLEHVIWSSGVRLIIVGEPWRENVEPVLAQQRHPVEVVWHQVANTELVGAVGLAEVLGHGKSGGQDISEADAPFLLSYTSGTSGPAKGALLSDRALRTCAEGVRKAVSATRQDRLLLWEPIYHNGGNQMLAYAVMSGVPLVVMDAFHASTVWQTIERHAVTHLHYIGGVLQILLRTTPEGAPPNCTLRIVWGGGCPAEIWGEVQKKLNVDIHEVYGMTETASITSVNTDGIVGSVGRPLDHFEVEIRDPEGRVVSAPGRGEICVRPRRREMMMIEYLHHPEVTAAAIRDGWMHTGDDGHLDSDGYLYFHGRLKDSVRRCGENVSAWEVESVVGEHPDVLESAMIGVRAEIGEQEIALFARRVSGSALTEAALHHWCSARMPGFQVPRYIRFIDSFERTPTQRVVKRSLTGLVEDAWDAEQAG